MSVGLAGVDVKKRISQEKGPLTQDSERERLHFNEYSGFGKKGEPSKNIAKEGLTGFVN